MRHVVFALFILTALFFAAPVWAKNIQVPFTSQAPNGDWRQPWRDGCEEAAVTMVDLFYRGHKQKRLDQHEAARAIRHAYDVKTKAYGWSLDENAAAIARLINDFYPWEASLVERPTVDQLKRELDADRPVIVPVHGKSLKNPHFRQGGPDYHTIVISGYDEDKQEFIVQEPGTRHGLDFRYSYATIMNAMHDLVPGKTYSGIPVAIFTNPTLFHSALTDGDQDNLSKIQELRSSTALWLRDSDDDGYEDGEEVGVGYSPTVAEPRLRDGAIVKAPDEPKVYRLEHGQKRHVTSERSFLAHGWQWTDILNVSSKFLSTLKDGLTIN